MTKAEEILEKHLAIMDAETMIGKHGRTHKAVINAINEAINYTHSCKSDSEQLFDFLEWFNNYCTVDIKPNKEDVELYLSK